MLYVLGLCIERCALQKKCQILTRFTFRICDALLTKLTYQVLMWGIFKTLLLLNQLTFELTSNTKLAQAGHLKVMHFTQECFKKVYIDLIAFDFEYCIVTPST